MVMKMYDIARFRAYVGASFNTFSLGIGFSRYGFNIDLGLVWVEVTW